ncbi:MAG TPA: hypothetical protein VFS31_14250, partial [Chitinophagaceae bacterium]|nr:hypothetical protein [Chitinophagaceae bacterium]
APCSGLDKTYQSTCYFWQTQWWAAAGAVHYLTEVNSVDEVYAYSGKLCSKLAGESQRRCFEGIGYSSVSSADSNPLRMKQLCLISAGDNQNRLYCRAFAANMLTNIPGSQDDASKLCEGLTGEGYGYCMDYVKNKGNFFTTLPAPGSENI